VGEIPWPHHFVIASLRRGTQVIIPKGDTVLYTEDNLTVVGEAASILEARKLYGK
jgi:Trk K+ transport system NAD-binding subunit